MGDPVVETCRHLDTVDDEIEPESWGCVDCLRDGGIWLHLRICMACGHIGCCNSSPNRHATAHFHEQGHPLIRSYEPNENWWWCYLDELRFKLDGAPPAPSHP